MNKKVGLVVGALFAMGVAQSAMAACTDVTRSALVAAAVDAASGNGGSDDTGGYGLPMWVTMVDETGKVCHVISTNESTDGSAAGDGAWDDDGATGALAGNSQWLGSRVISAQKANTANAFSVSGYAISTANLYSAVQPGGSLYGLQHSNPVDASRAYGGDAKYYGTNSDPLKNLRIGGVNVFGGGLALYNGTTKIGAIGVSGDTSCRDHAFAWLVRASLGKQPVGMGGITNFNVDASGSVQSDAGTVGDEMLVDTDNDYSGYWDAWQQPACPNTATGSAIGVIELEPAP